ncbi:aldehyde dehydrogenase family protein [Solimonas sp. K1W22B-7]|uniref:aldehyde dehydrogenase family protein n=1 Tax=Solimonas sp. K1W22B-7 TaxID=2303331 RepID=UPI000E336D20|nr:aldehyde dehydrogenase family protein [Solimonas sp. K1W22B-7]AXQ27992.1 aldehyde dehydrogenase family protein [Solimonas sp. K1W22B-7]
MQEKVQSIYPEGSPEAARLQMLRVFERQQETAQRWRRSTAQERIARIKALRDAMLAHQPALQEAGMKDFRKPASEVDLEILSVLADASEYLHSLKAWMKPHRVWPTRMTLGLKGWVQYEPRGRCLIISPWNYPLVLTFGPLVACLGGGNTAMVKPSELTPNFSACLAKILREVFPEEEVATFEGDATVSTELLKLPFDHIFFTGSPAIGKVVMAAAAKHLTSVTLELGGKSPTIVDESADLDAAAETIMWGKLLNSGQTCIAPDHVYVHESVREAFVGKSIAVIRQRYGDNPQAQMNSPDLAHIVNTRHTKRVAALLEDAKSRGARVLCGDFVSEDQQFVAPTLLDRLPEDASIMQEEIFGPLCPILPYRDIDEVIRRVNAGPKPLALYIFSKQQRNIDRVLQDTSSGGACINHVVAQFTHGNLPFGGVNNSGIGNTHGFWGFRGFSHEKAIVKTRFMLARMLFPPYTDKVRQQIKLLIGWLKLW